MKREIYTNFGKADACKITCFTSCKKIKGHGSTGRASWEEERDPWKWEGDRRVMVENMIGKHMHMYENVVVKSIIT